ncbi:hypothetical protein B0H14DRAFT_2796547 [Mycena olivaceomarginata]|nr:hypothetical protein B0H14DRAFT_2796547 [Mycena olivaceomarginata]
MSSLLPPRTPHRLCRPQLDAESMSRSPRATSHMRSNPGSPSPPRAQICLRILPAPWVITLAASRSLPTRRVPPTDLRHGGGDGFSMTHTAFIASPGTETILPLSQLHPLPPARTHPQHVVHHRRTPPRFPHPPYRFPHPPPPSPHLPPSTSTQRKDDERSLGVPRLSRPTSPAQVPHCPCTLIVALSRAPLFGPLTIH